MPYPYLDDLYKIEKLVRSVESVYERLMNFDDPKLNYFSSFIGWEFGLYHT